MNLYKVETIGVYGTVYVAAHSFVEAAQLVYDSGRKIMRIELVTSGALLIADRPDPGSDVLQDRIDRAVEYADLYSLPRLREILTGEAEHGE